MKRCAPKNTGAAYTIPTLFYKHDAGMSRGIEKRFVQFAPRGVTRTRLRLTTTSRRGKITPSAGMVELADSVDLGFMVDVDYIEAHKFSNNHMGKLKRDSVCGCFYCGKIFAPVEIEEWIIDDNSCDKDGTARCPYCGIDSVIGESSGFPVTSEFLEKMNQYWFG